MLKVNTYSTKGLKLTPISLPKEWEQEANPALLAQAMRVYIHQSHVGLRKAQTRSEVDRTTKKLYSQKGTGGARHGARSAPIFVGGGVALGPRPVKRQLNLSVRMRRKILGVVISEAHKEDRIVAADVSFKKTNEVQKFIDKVIEKKSPRVTFILSHSNLPVGKFVKNIRNARVLVFPSINAFDVFFGGNIIIDRSIFEAQKTNKERKNNKKS
jgi:large subunit ribosomal protein L4